MNIPPVITPVPKYNQISAKMVIFNKILSAHQFDVKNFAIANQFLLLLGAEKNSTASKHCHILLKVSHNLRNCFVWLKVGIIHDVHIVI